MSNVSKELEVIEKGGGSAKGASEKVGVNRLVETFCWVCGVSEY